ncbi:MAG: hypothetical protein JW776_06975 [Candidatus Lokiarchaeota archaeon]|nr:hypothetical protein [Candidatus Lokiarchaeota archaeon]
MAHFALVIPSLEYIILDPTPRKFQTYKEIGWDDQSIKNYLSNKENHEKIASFMTNTISFSASSRRNRFYEIYNQYNMLDLEIAFKGAVEGLTKLSKHFETHIISERIKQLQEKTLEQLSNLQFPMDKIHLYFKQTHESLYSYKRDVIRKIVSKFPSGVGIITHPKDGDLFKPYEYAVLGFDTIKGETTFSGHSEFVCHSWKEIYASLEDQQ